MRIIPVWRCFLKPHQPFFLGKHRGKLIFKMCYIYLLVLCVSSPLVHLEELWRESGQLQRTAEETGDTAAGRYSVKYLQTHSYFLSDLCGSDLSIIWILFKAVDERSETYSIVYHQLLFGQMNHFNTTNKKKEMFPASS